MVPLKNPIKHTQSYCQVNLLSLPYNVVSVMVLLAKPTSGQHFQFHTTVSQTSLKEGF